MQTRLEKKAETECEWKNHNESQRRWCRTTTYRTTTTYGKPQSPWNWKTKVPASDKHYRLSSFSKHCRLLASHIVHMRAALHAHVYTLTLLATRGLWVKLHLVMLMIYHSTQLSDNDTNQPNTSAVFPLVHNSQQCSCSSQNTTAILRSHNWSQHFIRIRSIHACTHPARVHELFIESWMHISLFRKWEGSCLLAMPMHTHLRSCISRSSEHYLAFYTKWFYIGGYIAAFTNDCTIVLWLY